MILVFCVFSCFFDLLRLRGPDLRSLDPQPLAFAYDVGVIALRGPQQNQTFSCILGMDCNFLVAGYELGSDSSVLLSMNSCGDEKRVLAPLSASQVHVVSPSSTDAERPEIRLQSSEAEEGESSEVELTSGGGAVHAVTFEQVLPGKAQSYNVGINYFTPYELAMQLQQPGTVIALTVAQSTETEGIFRDEKFLAALESLGALKAREFAEGSAYAFVGVASASSGSAGYVFAEALDLESNGTSISVFVPSPLMPREVNATGHVSLGRLLQGGGAKYRICWHNIGRNWEDPFAYLVEVGELEVYGPGHGQQWTCVAGELCVLTVTGSGLAKESSLTFGQTDSLFCHDRPDGLVVAHKDSMSDDLTTATYSLGVISRRTLGGFFVCWKHSDSEAFPPVIGKLFVTEIPCSFNVEASFVHNCSGLGFLETCAIQCAQGFQGSTSLGICRSKGEVDGRLPSCNKVSCSSASLFAIDAGSGACICAPGYFGQISWSFSLQSYFGECEPCGSGSLSACADGQYRSGCGGSDAGVCLNCTNAAVDEYYVSHGGVQRHGCQTNSCVKCPVGKYPKDCGGTSPGQCKTCLNMPNATPSSHFFSSAGDVDGVCQLSECKPDCGAGQYRVDCGGVSPGYCRACSKPDHGFYLEGSGGLEDKCPSAACGGCNVGFFRSGCDMMNEGACVPCTNGPGHFGLKWLMVVSCCACLCFCFCSRSRNSLSHLGPPK